MTDGLVVGVDHSEVMVRRARRRNAAAAAAGPGPARVRPGRGAAGPVGDPGAPFDTPFDAVLAVNNVGFWPDPGAHLVTARRLRRPGGRIALVSQPRGPGATAATTQAAAELSALLAAAGYTAIETETLDLDPPVACVLATPG